MLAAYINLMGVVSLPSHSCASIGKMKAAFIILSLALVAHAKPRVLPQVKFVDGKIIGGHDAEPRK